MTIGFVASALIGIVLGLPCRVYTLVPLTLLAIVAGVVAAFWIGLPLLSVARLAGVAILGLQLGYVCGSFGASIKEQPELEPQRAPSRRYGVPAK